MDLNVSCIQYYGHHNANKLYTASFIIVERELEIFKLALQETHFVKLIENDIIKVLFIALVCYSQIVVYRLLLAWFITINPYLFPWSYLVTAVDWLDDTLQGIIPGVFGVNITGGLILGAIGALADSLNHLVFTMPFLPSEGEPTKLVINNQLKDVLVFHYLPALWYKHPIPNDIREFWFTERPDILEYMKTAYGHLDLNLFPDSYIIHQQEMVGFSFLTDNFHSLF